MTEKNGGSSNWQKAPRELVEFFKSLWKDQPEVQNRAMFGYPCAFINGQMFSGLFGDRMFLRLPETYRLRFLAMEDGGPFEPLPGRIMKEYALVPPTILEQMDELRSWLALSKEYAAGLPLRAKKQKKTR